MIQVAGEPFAQLSCFLDYPDESLAGRLSDSLPGLRDWNSGVAGALEAFLRDSRDLSTTQMEELYTRTFDINPACTLEIGWILYGQQYERGAFLVRMRELLRDHGIGETSELPDHLTLVLRLLDRMDPEEADSFCREKLHPALGKMREGFADPENPYSFVLEAVELALRSFLGPGDGDEKHEIEERR